MNSLLYAENCQATLDILFRTGGLQPVLFDRKLPRNHRKFEICWMSDNELLINLHNLDFESADDETKKGSHDSEKYNPVITSA